MVNLLEYYKIV